jgi:hypothetical protein
MPLNKALQFFPLGLSEVTCETYRPITFEYIQENIHDSITHITPETLESVRYNIAASYKSVLVTDEISICMFSSLKLFQ